MASNAGLLGNCNFSNQMVESNMQDLNANPEPLEPYTGMPFKSVDDAKEFYNAYARRTGFTVRTFRIRHSPKSKAIIARDYVCSREGFRSASHRLGLDGVVSLKPTTRQGCKAMIRIALKDGGQWIVTKFIQEHNHKLLAPNIVRKVTASVCHFKTSELSEAEKDKKIEELFNELQNEKQRAARLQERLHLVLKDIEEHAKHMSVRVQDIVNNVREIESSEL